VNEQAACGGIFGPTAAVIAHWFKKRRGLAMGIVAVGSSVGGVVLPVVTKSLIPECVCFPGIASGSDGFWNSFPWTMRILGFILLVVLGAENLVKDLFLNWIVVLKNYFIDPETVSTISQFTGRAL